MTDWLQAPTPTLRQRVLDAIRVEDQVRIPPSVLNSLVVSVEDHMIGEVRGVLLRLSAHVYAEKTAEAEVPVRLQVTTTEYASWWQHTKAVHFPTLSRWLKRPPRMVSTDHVKERVVTVRQHVAYPNLSVAPRELGKPVVYESVEVSR